MSTDQDVSSSKRGFTLVELAIVIAILGLIAVVAIPRYQDMEKAAQASTCAGVRASITEAEMIRELKLHVRPSLSNPPLSPQQLKDQGYLTEDSSIVCPAGGTLSWIHSPDGTSWQLVCSIHSAAFVYDGTTTGFTTLNGTGVTVAGGALKFNNINNENRVAFGSLSWTDYIVNVTATLASGNGYGIYYRSDGVSGNRNPGVTGYCFQFDPGAGNRLTVRKVVSGVEQPAFQSVAMPAAIVASLHSPHSISVAVKGDHHVISVDGVVVLDFHDGTYSSGMAGLRGWSGCDPSFSALTVTPNP
ncbi:MAG: competence type IV pilus major pilin ComGC [Candidatus Cryosericum sp.]